MSGMHGCLAPRDKVVVLRQHLLEGCPSEIYERRDLNPARLYSRQRELF
ncbi:MAG: hypothetical protein KatS3mg110_1974 [Pirellulaceae bacterium]|nr:MAG: hypothetical protein KatS3mg110_1974 [Pirellulaceae bacterium]